MVDILPLLEKLGYDRGEEIEAWLAEKRREARPFFYSSVDLRHAGFKMAPVDTNLFPAGFNNLSPLSRARTGRFIVQLLQERYPQARNVTIIPENHTRNLGYLQNLAVLQSLLAQAGVEVHLGSFVARAGEPIRLEAPDGTALTQHALVRKGDRLTLDNGAEPDLIILNNDMTAGPSALLEGISQPVLPPMEMGWYVRRKSAHFTAYKALMEDFSARFGVDYWLLCAEFQYCARVDFKDRSSLEGVAQGVERVLSRVREKYRQYGVQEEPYVFVKADSGTYGMGIMTVRSGEEMLELNKKERNKMQVIKEGTRVEDVIIQEGVPTKDMIQGKPAEPMVYMIDGIPAGGMYRVNGSRDAHGNLNAAGMEFTGMCDEEEALCGEWESVAPCHFRSYGILAAIAALASAREYYGEECEHEAACC